LGKYAGISLTVTKALKAFIDSPMAFRFVEATPKNWDDTTRRIISDGLAKLIPRLQVTAECSSEQSMDEMVSCWLRAVGKQPSDIQEALLIKLASGLTGHQDGDRLKRSIYDVQTQIKYSGSKPAIVKG
jgi:hypothetical protein